MGIKTLIGKVLDIFDLALVSLVSRANFLAKLKGNWLANMKIIKILPKDQTERDQNILFKLSRNRSPRGSLYPSRHKKCERGYNWIAPIRIKQEHSPAFRTASSLPRGVGIIVLLLRPGPSLGQNILYYNSNKSRMHQFQTVSGFRSAMMASKCNPERISRPWHGQSCIIFRKIRADSYLGLY